MAEQAGYPKIAQFKEVGEFRAYVAKLGLRLPIDDRVLSASEGSPLAQGLSVDGLPVGNRWCIHPMEGWDANRDGSPSEHTRRRWRNFGLSGAKLIWGGEAAAVRRDGRANPNQMMATGSNLAGVRMLLRALHEAHLTSTGSLEGLVVGLQLTHSGRFCKPDDHHQSAPRIAYHHPLLDAKFKIDLGDSKVLWTDSELEELVDDYVRAARVAFEAGFQFVDIKACHGYLLHELLSARSRAGRFGGDLDGRSRMLTSVIERIRHELPELRIGVRLSVFDVVPFCTGREIGRPMEFAHLLPYQFGFGCSPDDPFVIDLAEPIELMQMLAKRGVSMINVTCGSPYYSPHIQRPAIFPPIDGYLPPEDPLVGVWRQIDVVQRCKEALPNVAMVGSGYSYLQDYLANVAQAVVREKWVDFVGIGRMVLAYPEFPSDVLQGRAIERKRVCRTFSDCTTAPRNGLISGCYPLDPRYKKLPERAKLIEAKKRWEG